MEAVTFLSLSVHPGAQHPPGAAAPGTRQSPDSFPYLDNHTEYRYLRM
jgi:hypothetical protein